MSSHSNNGLAVHVAETNGMKQRLYTGKNSGQSARVRQSKHTLATSTWAPEHSLI